MKKIVLALALMLATFAASASNTLYFTYNQALRTVTLLNNQNELMIYCGYADELPTYVLLNEVWAEQISSSFYEVWLYGYDAYTGEEVYMPIDLECIWLVAGGNIYSAAQTLRFRSSHSRPTFAWQIPHYNPFVRAPRPTMYYYSYHYDIHRPGWHWRHHPQVHYHPYYMRPPSHPAPMPPKPFTPGHDKPGYKTHQGAGGEIGYEYIPTNTTAGIAASRSQTIVHNDPSSRSGNRITSDRSAGTITTTDRITGNRSTVGAPEVSNSRGTSAGTRSNDNGRGTSTGTRANDNNRGTSAGTRSNVGSRGTSTTTQTGTRGTSTGTRSGDRQKSSTATETNTRGTSTGTRSSDRQKSSTTTETNTRGTSTGTRSSDRQKSSTTTETNTRGTSTGTRSGDRQKSSSTTTETNTRGTSTGTRSGTGSRGTSTGTRK